MTLRLKRLLGLLALLLAVAVGRWLTLPRPGPGHRAAADAARQVEQGDLGGAEQSLRAAILLEPGNGDYHAELGDVYLRQGRDEDAVPELEMAAHMAPARPHIYCQLAQALVSARRRADALPVLEIALRKAPDCPHALSVRGEQFLRDENMRAALDDFQRTIRLAPRFALAYQKAAYILLKSNRYEEAGTLLRKGLAVSPTDPGMHFLLGEVYLDRPHGPRELDLAEQEFKQSLPRNPETDSVHAALGQIALQKNDLKAARAEYQKALATSPQMADALYGLSQVARREGHAAEAAAILKLYESARARTRALDDLLAQALAHPENIDLQLRTARLALAGGALKNAARVLQTAVDGDPARREARELRGQLYLAEGRSSAAAEEFAVAGLLPRSQRQ
jgi:tetratricopeptide (TPR) repeat protein